jgi:hypothetical protein
MCLEEKRLILGFILNCHTYCINGKVRFYFKRKKSLKICVKKVAFPLELVLCSRTFKTKKCNNVGGTHLEFNSSARDTEAGG